MSISHHQLTWVENMCYPQRIWLLGFYRPLPIATVCGMSVFDANPDVLREWKAITTLNNRASTCSKISNILNKKIGRSDVVENYELLLPIIEFMGTKPAIEEVTSLCRTFLWQTRPRGKPDVTSCLIAQATNELGSYINWISFSSFDFFSCGSMSLLGIRQKDTLDRFYVK